MPPKHEIIERIQDRLRLIEEKTYGPKYHDHLVEQYKIYIGMAEKISDKRAITNAFFLSVNTLLVTLSGFSGFLNKDVIIQSPIIILTASAAILFCYVWYRLIRSYKDLNSAKFKVIHAIENLLPLRLFDAEWEGIGRGEDKKLYLPFTRIEIYIPFIFMSIYLTIVVYTLYKL